MDQLDQTGLQEFIPACASWFPLDRYKALAYFEQSSFYAAAGRDAAGQTVVVNNTEARLVGLDPAVPGVLESLPHGRPEFILETSQEPNAFVIRKQIRVSSNPLERPLVLAFYYIANNKIMQAPSAHQVTHCRLQRCTFALQTGFARLQADLEPLTRHAKHLTRLAARNEWQRQQQQEKVQPLSKQPDAKEQERLGEGHRSGQAAEAMPPSTSAAVAAAPGLGPDAALPHPAQGEYCRGKKANVLAGEGGTGSYFQPYGASVDLDSPSLGTLRAQLAVPLPEVMAAAAATPVAASDAASGGVPVRRHLTEADRVRWNKLDRILSHQFSSLQRVKYTALPPDYLQRLHEQMYGPSPAPAVTAAGADAAATAAQ